MVHTLPVKVKSAMLNIAEQLGIRNARRSGFRPYRTRNNSGGSSAEETAAGQCRRLDGHGPVTITERRPEPGVMVGAIRPFRSFSLNSHLPDRPILASPFSMFPRKFGLPVAFRPRSARQYVSGRADDPLPFDAGRRFAEAILTERDWPMLFPNEKLSVDVSRPFHSKPTALV